MDKTAQSIKRLVEIMMKRRLLPKPDADYILEPLGEKAPEPSPGVHQYEG